MKKKTIIDYRKELSEDFNLSEEDVGLAMNELFVFVEKNMKNIYQDVNAIINKYCNDKAEASFVAFEIAVALVTSVINDREDSEMFINKLSEAVRERIQLLNDSHK